MTSPQHVAAAAHASSRGRLWIVGFLLLAAAGAAYWYWGGAKAAPAAQRGRFGGMGGPNQAVPVRVVPVQRGTIDV
jgi:hypothetical protein